MGVMGIETETGAVFPKIILRKRDMEVVRDGGARAVAAVAESTLIPQLNSRSIVQDAV